MVLAQAAQRGCGCPIPDGVQSRLDGAVGHQGGGGEDEIG